MWKLTCAARPVSPAPSTTTPASRTRSPGRLSASVVRRLVAVAMASLPCGARACGPQCRGEYGTGIGAGECRRSADVGAIVSRRDLRTRRRRPLVLRGRRRSQWAGRNDMELRSGTWTVGPAEGTLVVRTKREGAAARMGHDLTLTATRWH